MADSASAKRAKTDEEETDAAPVKAKAIANTGKDDMIALRVSPLASPRARHRRRLKKEPAR